MKIKTDDIINFDVDYIELYGTLKNHKEILVWLDDDNSNYRNYKWFVIEKTDRIKCYQYKITFWKNNLPVFAWYLWDVLNEYIETKDYFTVYWAAFNVMNISEIVEFIHENIDVDLWSFYYTNQINKRLKEPRNHSHIIKRLDLACDIKADVKKVVKNFRKLKSKWSKYYDDVWGVQTYYIWEKKNTMNKNLLIRVYDKIADIKQKEKQQYYVSYLKEPAITRIELEFRSETLKFLELNQILDRSYIFWLFITYLKKHTQIFSRFDDKSVERLKKLDKRVVLEDLHWRQVVKNRYHNTFLGYAKKYIALWNCPVDVLLRADIISERTKWDIAMSIVEGNFDSEKYLKWITVRNLSRLFADNEKDWDWGD